VKLLFFHYAAETEVGDQQVGVIFGCAEEEVLRFEVAVHDAMIVEVGYGGEGGTDKIGGVGFKIGAFTTDAVEKLTAERKVGYEVYCITCQNIDGE
jgi:hypothetical protein